VSDIEVKALPYFGVDFQKLGLGDRFESCHPSIQFGWKVHVRNRTTVRANSLRSRFVPETWEIAATFLRGILNSPYGSSNPAGAASHCKILWNNFFVEEKSAKRGVLAPRFSPTFPIFVKVGMNVAEFSGAHLEYSRFSETCCGDRRDIRLGDRVRDPDQTVAGRTSPSLRGDDRFSST
jgi:hypothetical protein